MCEPLSTQALCIRNCRVTPIHPVPLRVCFFSAAAIFLSFPLANSGNLSQQNITSVMVKSKMETSISEDISRFNAKQMFSGLYHAVRLLMGEKIFYVEHLMSQVDMMP